MLFGLTAAPVFLTQLQNQEVPDGYPVSFDCVIIGKPSPSVRWFKDGKVLKEDDHYMINEDQEGCHQLIITAVRPLDMGVYRCVAENDAGIASSKVELRVESEYAGEKVASTHEQKVGIDLMSLFYRLKPVFIACICGK